MTQNTFTPHLEILPQPQREFWPQLRDMRNIGFVLYGGTAIALRLGHRQSIDFDFFRTAAFDADDLFHLLPILNNAQIIQQEENGLSLLIEPTGASARPIKISFFGNITFGRVGIPQLTDDGVLSVASLEDLMGTKLKVLLQRVESKDYRDIAALLAHGMDLSEGLAFASALFAPNFPAGESLRALTYFEGGDLQTLSMQEKAILIKASQGVRELPVAKRLGENLTV